MNLKVVSKAFFFLLFFLLILAGCSKGDSDGAMFRGNLERTGEFPDSGPKKLTELLWKFKTEKEVLSSPAISNGVVYFGSFNNSFYAINIKTGQEKWKFKTGSDIVSSPAISDGVIFFGSADGTFYAVK